METIQVGETAPDFKLPLVQGGEFHLARTLKAGPVVMNFIRGTWCQFCTSHLGRVRQWQDGVESGATRVTTVVISSEPLDRIREWLADNPMPFLFASDVAGEVGRMYGVQLPEESYSRPAMILVDRDATVRLAAVNEEALSAPGLQEECVECFKGGS